MSAESISATVSASPEFWRQFALSVDKPPPKSLKWAMGSCFLTEQNSVTCIFCSGSVQTKNNPYFNIITASSCAADALAGLGYTIE